MIYLTDQAIIDAPMPIEEMFVPDIRSIQLQDWQCRLDRSVPQRPINASVQSAIDL